MKLLTVQGIYIKLLIVLNGASWGRGPTGSVDNRLLGFSEAQHVTLRGSSGRLWLGVVVSSSAMKKTHTMAFRLITSGSFRLTASETHLAYSQD